MGALPDFSLEQWSRESCKICSFLNFFMLCDSIHLCFPLVFKNKPCSKGGNDVCWFYFNWAWLNKRQCREWFPWMVTHPNMDQSKNQQWCLLRFPAAADPNCVLLKAWRPWKANRRREPGLDSCIRAQRLSNRKFEKQSESPAKRGLK